MGGALVSYGLGNFVWYSDTSNPDTGVLQLTLTDSVVTDVAYVPAMISRQTGQPMPVTGGERERILDKLDGLRSCTNLIPTSQE